MKAVDITDRVAWLWDYFNKMLDKRLDRISALSGVERERLIPINPADWIERNKYQIIRGYEYRKIADWIEKSKEDGIYLISPLDDVGGEDGVFLLPNRKKAPTSVSLVPWLLFYDAFAFVVMLCLVVENTFFTCIGVTIYAEVAAGVVHSDVLAYHTTTNLALTSVFHLSCLHGDRRKLSEHVTLRPFEGV